VLKYSLANCIITVNCTRDAFIEGAGVDGDSEGKYCLPMPVNASPCKVKNQNHPSINEKAQRRRWALKIFSC
jgi:hypothetical protein